MTVKYGKLITKHGPGVVIKLTGDEAAEAIDHWLKRKQVFIHGPRTITVNGELCQKGRVYVDPGGMVIHNGKSFDGRGFIPEEEACKTFSIDP